MMFIAPYLALIPIILGINTIPGLMPPTWTVLAFFVTKYDLYTLPVVVIGASSATLGRIILANISEKFFSRFLSKESRENYLHIGEYLNSHKKITIPLVITYAFFPIPSNDVFIAAGLAKVNIKLLAWSFFVGRLISYTFWVKLTQHLADNIIDIFSKHYSHLIPVVTAELSGILILYIVGKIAWKKVLKNKRKAV